LRGMWIQGELHICSFLKKKQDGLYMCDTPHVLP
jgi:hypothetical protein